MSPKRETLAARVALGLAALDVADDSFLQPETGRARATTS